MPAGSFWILETAYTTRWCPALTHLLRDLKRKRSPADSGHREIGAGRSYGALSVWLRLSRRIIMENLRIWR